MIDIKRAVICILQSDPKSAELATSVKPVALLDDMDLEEHESPERDLIVLSTCLGTLIREVEDKGYLKPGQAMEAAIKTLNNVYVTNDIKLTVNEDEHTGGSIKGD